MMHASDARLLLPEFVTVKFTRVFCSSSTATHAAVSFQRAVRLQNAFGGRVGGGRGPPLLPPPSQCICSFVLPPACQSHSCQPSPVYGRTLVNCVHGRTTANVYIAELLIRLKHRGFDLGGRHAPSSAPIYTSVQRQS